MKDIADKIRQALNENIIDWNTLEKYVGSLGEKINMYDEQYDESILSESYKAHFGAGYINEKLTDLFINYGFDVAANGGRNGASCLRALCWSSYDKYILNIAEKLLNLGADSTLPSAEYDEEEGKGVLSSIEWKLGEWNTGEYDSANLFTSYYDMIERHQNGKEYKGIRAFRDSVGETVNKVEKLKVLINDKERTSYLLICGDKHLIVSDYIELMINPYVRDEALEIEDVSADFRCIIGAKVKGLRYLNASLAKLNFDNGYTITLGSNDSMGITETGAWLRIAPTSKGRLPKTETSIESIRLWGQRTHAKDSTFYSEDTVVLITKNCAYALYSHDSGYRNKNIRVEEFSKGLMEGLSRSIKITNPIIKYVECSNVVIQWMLIKCEEGFLYIVTNRFAEMALFMSKYELDRDDVLKVDFFTKGMKKIDFIEY